MLGKTGAAIVLQKTIEIAIGIDLLDRHTRRGQVLSSAEIARVCGCSSRSIEKIEQAALKKLKRAAQKLNLNDYLVEEITQ